MNILFHAPLKSFIATENQILFVIVDFEWWQFLFRKIIQKWLSNATDSWKSYFNPNLSLETFKHKKSMVCGLHNSMVKKKDRTFFLTGLQYLFKPHILNGLSIHNFYFFNSLPLIRTSRKKRITKKIFCCYSGENV